MLKHLYIKDYALIDELDIDFHPGFSVITGETGAGKSIILGAIGLLLGNRAGSKTIKNGKKRCIIEAHFDLSQYDMNSFFEHNNIDSDTADTIIRRELTASGKSRAFINDTPVPLALMRELGEQLIDIHSQHQNLLLQKEDFQLHVVDIIAADQQVLNEYRRTYHTWKTRTGQLEQLRTDIAQSKENEEFLRFQIKEIEQANLHEGIQEELEQEGDTLSHTEEIKSALYQAEKLLYGEENGIVERLKTASNGIESIAGVLPEAQKLSLRLNSSYIELSDIADEISSLTERIDFDPQRLDDINQQLDAIYALEKRFHVQSVNDILDIGKRLKEQLRHIDRSDEELTHLQEQVAQARRQVEKQANLLTRQRRQAALRVEEEMKRRLAPLGIPNVRFQVNITPKALAADGADKVCFLFSANKSSPMQPVAQVASGGEIARVMLSLKAMISGAVKLPTIIFDEIDTGVSGKIAEKMAQIMREMGDNDRQVISITHLPQIAALGTTHYKVAKDETPEGTTTHMTLLDSDERVKEIAQMLSGSNITEAALANARSLLKNENTTHDKK